MGACGFRGGGLGSGRLFRFDERLRLALQREPEYIFDPAHRLDVERRLHALRNVRKILDVFLRNQHGLDASALCRLEEHTSELQSLMRISYAVFCLKKNTKKTKNIQTIEREA